MGYLQHEKHAVIDFEVTVWLARDNSTLGTFAMPWQFDEASRHESSKQMNGVRTTPASQTIIIFSAVCFFFS